MQAGLRILITIQKRFRSRGDKTIVREGLLRRADAWTLSQVLATAVTAAQVGAIESAAVKRLWAGLEEHTYQDRAYTGAARRGIARPEVYYDDNAWIGLVATQSALQNIGSGNRGAAEHDLKRARMILTLMLTGEEPGGGVRWKEGKTDLHSCSTGPAGILSLRVVEIERLLGKPTTDHGHLIAFGARCGDFLDRLTDDRGVVADHLKADGTIDGRIWSYNQGVSIGLSIQLARTGGLEPHRSRAMYLSKSVMAYYADRPSELWHDPPVFVSILARNLFSLAQLTGDPGPRDFVRDWLSAVESHGRHPTAGTYTQNGIGRYHKRPTIDEAGIAYVHFAQEWPPDMTHMLC